MHYIVLGGGVSPEKTVSLRSAGAVQTALEELGHTVNFIDPEAIGTDRLLEEALASDGVFPILHGIGGEDGVLQELFEKHAIPHFGPSRQACVTSFNKATFKTLLEQNSIPTPRWNTISAAQLTAEPLAQRPFVLKPITGGSSIDTFIVRSIPFEPTPLLDALNRYGTMLIEELIEGHEITVGVLEDAALPVVEIIPPQDQEFDYENKYNGATQELCPPENISKEIQEAAQELALRAHTVTQGRHLSRTDILIDKNNALYIIDTNTIPGLTRQSLYPKAATAAGYEWTALVQRFTELLEAHATN